MDEQFVNELAVALRKVGTIHTVGEEWHSYTGEIPVGGVPYTGQMVTRATYSALWKYAQEKYLVLDEANWQMYAQANGGNVPFYSSGDGSTTFRMPKIVGYVKGASSQSEAGTHLFEGLPNIAGSVGLAHLTANGGEGALRYNNGSNAANYGTTASSNAVSVRFDASLSNSIYGASDHVTPETSVVLFGVYAFGALVECGELDAPTLATAVARVESSLGDYLPLSGGTMSGDIRFGGKQAWFAHIEGETQYRTVIQGATGWSDGGGLYLYGKDYTTDPAVAGGFHLRCSDGTNGCFLQGKPDGTLTWNGKNATHSAPDLSAGVSYSAGTTYTIPSDGFIYIEAQRNDDGGSSLTLTVNGSTIRVVANNYSSDRLNVPVYKGDTVKYSKTSNNTSPTPCIFYPVR